MKGRILFSVILVLALACFAVPAAAYLCDDVWVDKGIRTNTAINGNITAGPYVSVSQQVHYYYNPWDDQWIADINITGTAYRLSSTGEWTDATGSFGVYAARSDDTEKSGKFGTHTVVYTDAIRSKFDSSGSRTLYSDLYISDIRNCCDCNFPCPLVDPDGSFSIIVVGYIDDYLAISTTEATT